MWGMSALRNARTSLPLNTAAARPVSCTTATATASPHLIVQHILQAVHVPHQRTDEAAGGQSGAEWGRVGQGSRGSSSSTIHAMCEIILMGRHAG